MGIRNRLVQSGMFPDVSKLTDEFNAKFGELRDRLDTIIERLDTLIAQRGPQ